MWIVSGHSTLLAALPAGDQIRRKAEEVLARPDYDLKGGLDRETVSLLFRIIMWVLTPIRWLLERMEGLPWPLRWVIIAILFALLIALVTHIIWTFIRAVRGTSLRRAGGAVLRERAIAPQELETEADQLASRGNLIGAIRLLFRASLRRIELMEEKPFRRGITNREILRRYRSTPLRAPLGRLVDTIDACWYGETVCQPSDLETSRADYAAIRTHLERGRHAVRA